MVNNHKPKYKIGDKVVSITAKSEPRIFAVIVDVIHYKIVSQKRGVTRNSWNYDVKYDGIATTKPTRCDVFDRRTRLATKADEVLYGKA